MSIGYAFLCHHIVLTNTKEMIMYFYTTHEMLTHFLYVAREDYALF